MNTYQKIVVIWWILPFLYTKFGTRTRLGNMENQRHNDVLIVLM